MSEPEFRAHVLGICNLLILHVDPSLKLKKKKKSHNGLKQTDYMFGMRLLRHHPLPADTLCSNSLFPHKQAQRVLAAVYGGGGKRVLTLLGIRAACGHAGALSQSCS